MRFRATLVALALLLLPGCLGSGPDDADGDPLPPTPEGEFEEPGTGDPDVGEGPGDGPVAEEPRCPPPTSRWTAAEENGVRLLTVASGLHRPIHVADPNDGTGRLMVLEKAGTVRILCGDRLLPEPYVNLTDRVRWGGEQGLLALAFHPAFQEKGLLFLAYTDHSNAVVVARFRVDPADPDRLDKTSATTVLRVEKTETIHNGGTVTFGPDGHLYVSLGDGGGAGDPNRNGQNPATLLGSVLRIDVDGGSPYAVPPDNPFASGEGGAPEVWAFGLRNPWRVSFDRATGDLWIADVGQNVREEVNVAPAGVGGLNFGWSVWEGTTRFRGGDTNGEHAPPVHEYGRDAGCAVIGGHVYRGERLPFLRGAYVFSDLCAGRVWALEENGGRWERRDLVGRGLQVVSLAEDAKGELFVIDQQGMVYRLALA